MKKYDGQDGTGNCSFNTNMEWVNTEWLKLQF
jgi:hypothetical protein